LYKVPFFSPLLVILQRDRPRPAPLPLPPASDIGHFFENLSRMRFFTSWLGSIQSTRSNPLPSSSSFPIRSSRPCTQYVHLMLKPHLHQTHGENRILSMSIRMVTYVQSILILVFASRVETTASQICASILGDDWSPTLSVMAICITIQSMLASCKVRLWY
jgi:hypothetical protein